MREESTNSDAAEDTPWFYSLHFSNGVKRPLCRREKNPESSLLPLPPQGKCGGVSYRFMSLLGLQAKAGTPSSY